MTRKQSKQARMDVGSPAEASPHILRASSYYQRSIHRRNRSHRRETATVEVGRRNPLVDEIRLRNALGGDLGGRQPGRRCGPPPKNWAEKRAPTKPMHHERRQEIYCRNGEMTQRQWRQWRRMFERQMVAELRDEAVSNG